MNEIQAHLGLFIFYMIGALLTADYYRVVYPTSSYLHKQAGIPIKRLSPWIFHNAWLQIVLWPIYFLRRVANKPNPLKASFEYLRVRVSGLEILLQILEDIARGRGRYGKSDVYIVTLQVPVKEPLSGRTSFNQIVYGLHDGHYLLQQIFSTEPHDVEKESRAFRLLIDSAERLTAVAFYKKVKNLPLAAQREVKKKLKRN